MARNTEFDSLEIAALKSILEDDVDDVAAEFRRLRTHEIGVSANVSQDQNVASDSETRLAVDDVTPPYFDDFGELDDAANEIVLEHGSHHELKAHAGVDVATNAGQFWLRIYVNGTLRARDHQDVKNGEEGVLSTSVHLKLDAGDVVYATVEHDTGSTETFPGASGQNYLSSIRQ